jgi:acetoin utilization deacetylase AcuC-like enzyme
MARTGVVLDSAYLKHELEGHVERPDRVRRIAYELTQSDVSERVRFVRARRAKRSEVLLAHSPQVLQVTKFPLI